MRTDLEQRFSWTEGELDVEFEKFNPSQPRDPAGSETGGQWTGGGATGSGQNLDELPAEDNAAERLDAAQAGLRLSAAEKYALLKYRGDSYDWNQYLRGGGEPVDTGTALPTEGLIERNDGLRALDSAFDKAPPLDEAVVVWRGGASAKWSGGALNNGDVLEDLGYTSTSTHVVTAHNFAAKQADDTMFLYRIGVTPGQRALWMPAAGDRSETELLLRRGTRYRVLSSNTISARSYFEAHWQGQRPFADEAILRARYSRVTIVDLITE